MDAGDDRDNVHDVTEIKQELSDEGTLSTPEDCCMQLIVKLVPVSNSKQPVKSTVKLRSCVRRKIPEKPYQCNLCSAKFSRMYKLTPHITKKHKRRDRNIPAYRCAVCSNVLYDAAKLRHHLEDHFNVNVPSKSMNRVDKGMRRNRKSCLMICETCGKSVADLRKHHLMHSGTRARPQACKICGKLVNDMYKHKKVHRGLSQTCEISGVSVVDMQRHIQVHEETRSDSQPREICGKLVIDACKKLELDEGNSLQSRASDVCGEFSADMHTHEQTQSNCQPCEVCGKVVADQNRHRLTHKKQTPNSKSCNVCGKVVVDLYRHQKIHSGIPSHSQSCNICGKSVIDMYKHKLVHRRVERPLHLCTVCGKSVKDLRRHRQIHEGIKRSVRHQEACNVCGKVVTNIRVHQRTHEEHGRECQCTQCGRCYATDKSLKDHIKTHSSQKKFVCAECGKHYSSKTALSTHMWTHSTEPRHRCSVCGKAFLWYVTWKRHLWSHGIGINQSHNCPVCTKCFASPYLLRDHLMTHSGEKPYMCSQCGRQFTHRSSLISHQKCLHYSKKKSNCPECGKAICAARMAEHMRSMHRGILHKCPHCKLEFRQQEWLNWHVLFHAGVQPFICEDCGNNKDISLVDRFTDFPEVAGIDCWCTISIRSH